MNETPDIESHTRALEERLGRVEGEMRAVLNSVAYDVRAPLRGLYGFALALQEDHSDKLDRTALDYVVRIRTAARRMERMLDAVLRLSQLSELEPVIERSDLTHMADDILKALAESAPERRVTVHVARGLRVSSDRAMLRLLLGELLTNAWKFSGETPAAVIHLRREPAPEGRFRFSVRDNGAGFDVTAAGERLYGLFQRFHAPDRFPGEGAGLALARRAAILLGGGLDVESSPGGGAVFICEIPDGGSHAA